MVSRPKITVSAIVKKNEHYLMVKERVKQDVLINQPGGHLENNESLADAAVRETLEETGATIEITSLVGIYHWVSNDPSYLRFCFAADLLSHDPTRPLDNNIIAAQWMDKQQIIAHENTLRSPAIIKSLDDYELNKTIPLCSIQEIVNQAPHLINSTEL